MMPKFSRRRRSLQPKIRPILVIEDDDFDYGDDGCDEEVEEPADEEDVWEEEEVIENYLVSNKDTDRPVHEISFPSKNIMNCIARINSARCNVILDSGASSSVMSEQTALRLGVLPDNDIKECNLFGAGRLPIPCRTSVPVPVSIDDHQSTDVRFHLMNNTVPTLLSRDVMAE